MNDIKIYLSENSDLATLEREMAGYAGDVLVFYKKSYYNVIFETIDRVNTTFKWDNKHNDVSMIFSHTIITNDVKIKTIIDTIIMHAEVIFSVLKPIDLEMEYKNTFPELQNIDNWAQIY